MTDGKWSCWEEPTSVLLATANRFLKQIDFSNFPVKRVHDIPYKRRKRQLAVAFASYIKGTPIGDFLTKYNTSAIVHTDVFSLVLTYMLDSELRYEALHNEEVFPQTEIDLLEDFSLYLSNF